MILLAILLAAFLPTSTNDFHFVKFPEPKARSASPEYKSLYAVPNFGSDYSTVPKYVGTWECVAPGPLWSNPYYPYISQWKFAIVMEGIEERKGMFAGGKAEFNIIKSQYAEKRLYSTNSINTKYGYYFKKMPVLPIATINVEGFANSNTLEQISIAIDALGGDSTRIEDNYVGLDCATNGQWVYSNYTNAMAFFESTETLNQMDWGAHFITNQIYETWSKNYDSSYYRANGEHYTFGEITCYDGEPSWEKVESYDVTNETGYASGSDCYWAITWAGNTYDAVFYTDKGHRYEGEYLHTSYSPRHSYEKKENKVWHLGTGEDYWQNNYASTNRAYIGGSCRIEALGAIQFFKCTDKVMSTDGETRLPTTTQTVWVATYRPASLSQNVSPSGRIPIMYTYPTAREIVEFAGFQYIPSPSVPSPGSEHAYPSAREDVIVHSGKFFYPIYRFSNRVK